MPDNLEGYLLWDIHSFDRFLVGGVELVLDHPYQFSCNDASGVAQVEMLTGTTVNQSFYMGGNAPINISPKQMSMSFDFGSKDDLFRICRPLLLAAKSSQGFFPAYWIEEAFHLNSNPTKVFRISRYFPYDVVTQAQYPPEVFIDQTQQTIITSGTPASGEVLIPETGDDELTLYSGATGTYVYVRYPPMFYLSRCTMNNNIPEEIGTWTATLEATELLANKDYTISTP